MITHDFTYEFYFFENVKPYINIKITPLFEDIIPPTQGDHISVGNIFAATAYNTDKSMINKVINEMKDTINGKNNFCEYEEEWLNKCREGIINVGIEKLYGILGTVSSNEIKLKELLETPLGEVGFSNRTFNCLRHAGVKTLEDMVKRT